MKREEKKDAAVDPISGASQRRFRFYPPYERKELTGGRKEHVIDGSLEMGPSSQPSVSSLVAHIKKKTESIATRKETSLTSISSCGY